MSTEIFDLMFLYLLVGKPGKQGTCAGIFSWCTQWWFILIIWQIFKIKDVNVGCFITISNLRSADAFFRGVKATFWIKNVRGKRQDNAEKDTNSHLFLGIGKSAVKFWVDTITLFDTSFQESTLNIVNVLVEISGLDDLNKFSRCISNVLGHKFVCDFS